MVDDLGDLPDAVGRAQAIAEDALLRATNAQEIAEDALDRAARPDALDRAARAQALGEDALARADHARAAAGDAGDSATFATQAAQEGLLAARIAAFSTWLELRPPTDGPLVTVVLATRDRPGMLPRAVASVLAQRYPRWELIVIDDGVEHDAAVALREVDDDRVTVLEGPRRGLGAARNAGLDRAAGEVICYLDDDNVMHAAWLLAVAHVMGARADVDVLYGVTLAEHRDADALDPAGWWPAFWQLPWSRETLLEQNVTDAGAIAHRRDLDAARFDEGLTTGEDWDLLLRLTVDREALAVPAPSHAYAISHADRMSRDPDHQAGLEEIRRRHAGT